MNGRKVWIGIVGGLLAGAVLLSVGLGAYRAGQRDDVVTRTVTDGEVVRVVGDHGWGPGPGFFLIPVLGIILVVLLVRGGRRWGGWGHPYGPGPWGPPGQGSPFDEWHRRAHEAGVPPASDPASTTGPQS